MTNILATVVHYVVICFIASRLGAQDDRICGAVQNETGAAAAFVAVVAFYTGAHSGPEDTTKTDGKGEYCIEKVRPGEYVMSAQDARMGYSLMLETFYMPHYLAGSDVTILDSSPHQTHATSTTLSLRSAEHPDIAAELWRLCPVLS